MINPFKWFVCQITGGHWWRLKYVDNHLVWKCHFCGRIRKD